MQKDLDAFQIQVNGKTLDYRIGQDLDLAKVKQFFAKTYQVKKLWSAGRHVLGILEKDNTDFFLKLATTEGIGAVTEIEYKWNDQFNKLVSRQTCNFWIPQNIDSGMYNNTLFFLITDYFNGQLLAQRPEKTPGSNTFASSISAVVEFSELIQTLPIEKLSTKEDASHRDLFVNKTRAWYKGIPESIRETYRITDLLHIVEDGASNLEKRPRHGDFTPWHIMKLNTGQLGLIDGEHAMANGVEYYDICYFIQRVFSVLENPKLAEKLLLLVLKRNYNKDKLRIILAARAIGGFLDESLKPSSNYQVSNSFKDWVVQFTMNAT